MTEKVDVNWVNEALEYAGEGRPNTLKPDLLANAINKHFAGELTDYNERLELAKQRTAIVERVMKLPYIKATRDTERGEERFVARDDLIKAIHDYATMRRTKS